MGGVTANTKRQAGGASLLPVRPVRWPIMPEPAAFSQFRQQHPTDAADPQLWRRWARAAHLWRTGSVGPDLGGYRMVNSQHTAGERYAVALTPDGGQCDCGDAVWRNRRWCKHMLACYIAEHAKREEQRQRTA